MAKNTQKVTHFSDGLSAGLKYWLGFMLGFYLLGYSARLSILLGAVGGLAAGWAIAWWKTTEEPRTQEQVEAIKKNESDLAGATIRRRQMRPNRSLRYRRTAATSKWKFWNR